MKTNIKINYMLLEQILRVTGTYKNICNEHEFLDIIFKQAKTGEIDSLFKDDSAKSTALKIIESLTGVSSKYWSGEERIKLGIRCKNEDLNYDGESIDTVDLSKDGYDKDINEFAYHGILYKELLENPLHLDFEEIYLKVYGEDSSEIEIEEGSEVIESLYSLRGLLTVLLINMADEIELIDKANIYKHTKWELYIRILSKPTQDGVTYSPKFIEIRKGRVQTIIKNIFDLGYAFTFRDLEKEFII